MKRIKFTLAAVAAMFAGLAAFADETISADTTLTADRTVSGTLTVEAGATVNLNGHKLTVSGLAGTGKIAAGRIDLTMPETTYGTHVTAYTNGVFSETGILYSDGTTIRSVTNLFSNINGNASKTILYKTLWPLEVVYDFGDGQAKTLIAYKVYCGRLESINHTPRAPKVWYFYGSNDNSSWTLLDQRTNETGWPQEASNRLYSFSNETAYRYYKLKITSSQDPSKGNGYLELNGLEYYGEGNPGELHINVPEGVTTTNSTVTIDSAVKVVKDGKGMFRAQKTGQTYHSGTIVSNGTLSVAGNGNTEHILGNGYKFLEYIQTSDTSGSTTSSNAGTQWINSEYTPKGSDRVVAKVQLTGSRAGKNWIFFFATRGTSRAKPFLAGISGGGNDYFRVDIMESGSHNGIKYERWFDEATKYDVYEIDVDGHSGTCTVKDETNEKLDAFPGMGIVVDAYDRAAGPFSILGFYDSDWDLSAKKGTALGYIPLCKLYSFKVYDKDGNIKCDMVPAMRTYDGEVGMYDRARDLFFGNYGTGSFIAGPEVGVLADVKVESGAVLEFASGARDFCDYKFTLNGGTLKNSSGAGTNPLFATVCLADDSYIENTASGGFVGRDSAAATLDLGGHTLNFISENSKHFYFKDTTITDGKVIFAQHLYVNIEGAGVIATNTTIESTCLYVLNAPLLVKDVITHRSNSGTIATNLCICGTLTPVTAGWIGGTGGSNKRFDCTMMDGSTLDLSLSSVGFQAGIGSYITFEDNATIAIRLGGNHVGNPLVSWTTAPANLDTLKFVKAEGESGYSLKVKDNGLYATRGLVIVVK